MKKSLFAGVMLLPLMSGNLLAEGGYSLGIGADYSSGDYGTGSTATLLSVPVSLGYQGDGWGWGLSVPYLSLRSKGNVVVGSGGMMGGDGTGTGTGGGGPGGGSGATTTTESGLGDVTLRGSLELAEEGERLPWLGVTVKAKLATADLPLGTGENDYAVQLEAAKGRVDGYVGYKLLGDYAYVDSLGTPVNVDFNNVAYGAMALSHETSDETRLSVEGYLEQPAISGNDPKREVSLIVDHWLDDDRRISGYVMKGFTDASPDWGGGISLKYSL